MNLSPDFGAPADFPYGEKMVARTLGWNKDEARAMRHTHLTAADWTRHKKRVYLAATGVQKLFRAARLPGAEKNAPAPASSIPALEPGLKEDFSKKPAPQSEEESRKQKAESRNEGQVAQLRVVRADLANRRMLLCCPAGQNPERPETTARVRVRSAENFRRGMEVPAVLVAGYSDLYDLARALPRKKGKW